jgi:hypothetical protein
MLEAPPRPRYLPQGRNGEARGEGRIKAYRALNVDVTSFLETKTGRIETRQRPPDHQHALREEVNEDGDPPTPTTHREAGRPLGVLRPEGRFLRIGNQPQQSRSLHGQSK